jgi:hypothetical protein
MRLLFDQGAPLLRVAEDAGFDILWTTDNSIGCQAQNGRY